MRVIVEELKDPKPTKRKTENVARSGGSPCYTSDTRPLAVGTNAAQVSGNTYYHLSMLICPISAD